MFSNILVAVDLAHERSWEQAMPVASELARRDGATLHVVTVAPDFGATMVSSYFPPGAERDMLARAREQLDAFVAEHTPKDVKALGRLEHGHAAEKILHAAEETRADLIVMSSHQPDRMRSLLIGSVADRVVHGSPVSVLVVRSPA